MFRTSTPATSAAFLNRASELARIGRVIDGLRAGTPKWLAILGQRKVGKTSLLLEAARKFTDERVRFVVLDVFDALPVSSEFFRRFALAVLDATLGDELGLSLSFLETSPAQFRRLLQDSSLFLRLTPAVRGWLLELPDRPYDPAFIRDVLQLPEKIAEALGLHLVVAIDEFQEIAKIADTKKKTVDPLPLMRSTWQKHQRVAYIISGSERTALTTLVSAEHSPFFQHFDVMDLGAFSQADAIALLTHHAPEGSPIPPKLAARAVDVLGGQPFYLQLLGEVLTASPGPYDEGALKEALQMLLFSRTGRLSLYFANEHQRLVGNSTGLAATLEALSAGPIRTVDVAARIRASSGATTHYLERLGDAAQKLPDGRYSVTDPVFGAWIRWRSPGGTVVPMKLVGDEAEQRVADHLASMGFDLIYQSRASRGAFDLLAVRGARQLGVQVKRSALPLRFSKSAWNRMVADAGRWGWKWAIAAVSPEGAVLVLDPRKANRGNEVRLTARSVIENVLTWTDG